VSARQLIVFSSGGQRRAADPYAGSAAGGRASRSAPAAAMPIRKNFLRNGWPSAREAADFLQLTWPPVLRIPAPGSAAAVQHPGVRLQLQGGSGRTPGPEARPGDRLGFLQCMWPPADRCAGSSTAGGPRSAPAAAMPIRKTSGTDGQTPARQVNSFSSRGHWCAVDRCAGSFTAGRHPGVHLQMQGR